MKVTEGFSIQASMKESTNKKEWKKALIFLEINIFLIKRINVQWLII